MPPFTNTFTEGHHIAEWLLSEANGHQSRAAETMVHAAGNDLPSGRILGRITASGKFTELAPAAGDGSQNAAGVLYGPVDATAADAPCLVIVRGAEVKLDPGYTNDLGTPFVTITFPAGATTNQKNQAIADLAALGIIVRS